MRAILEIFFTQAFTTTASSTQRFGIQKRCVSHLLVVVFQSLPGNGVSLQRSAFEKEERVLSCSAFHLKYTLFVQQRSVAVQTTVLINHRSLAAEKFTILHHRPGFFFVRIGKATFMVSEISLASLDLHDSSNSCLCSSCLDHQTYSLPITIGFETVP